MSDEGAFDELRDTLWYQLACRCHACGVELDLSEFDRLQERDAVAWSRVAAERASEQGWQPLAGEIGVICPACAARQN
jgi:hypothetical protein